MDPRRLHSVYPPFFFSFNVTCSKRKVDDGGGRGAVLSHFRASNHSSKLRGMASALSSAAADIAAGRPVLKPAFPAISANGPLVASETRTIRCPSHRYTPLKENWDAIVKPIVEHMKLMIRSGCRRVTR